MSSGTRAIRVVLFLALVFALPLQAQPGFVPANSDYDPRIPSPERILDFELGTTFTRFDEMQRYITVLAERSDPSGNGGTGRLKLFEIGRSNERRPLFLLAISSPRNLARLPAIKAGIHKLADPRVLQGAAEATALVDSLPAIVWLNYGIHGDESASFEAAMRVAYHLVAARDSLTTAMLDNVVALLNMCHNPESHERFVTWYNGFKVGAMGTADPNAAEHHDPWGMNTVGNHYQIDLNRDWFIASQVETQAVLAAYREWEPQVLVDHHGETENYFFGPQAEPINRNIPVLVRKWFGIYADGNARAFDQYGWSYFGGEEFDEFYPGYSSAWACLNGAVGMTYETVGGGDRGLQVERWDDGTLVTLRDGIDQHFVASLATLATTAARRAELLRDFFTTRRKAIEDGKRARMRRFLLLPGDDPLRCAALVTTLLRQGIEVQQATTAFRLEKVHGYFSGITPPRRFPAGTYIIDAAQPLRALLTAILEPEPYLHPTDTLTSTGEWSEPYYDLTAWALPYAYHIEAYWSEDGRPIPGRAVQLTDFERVPTPKELPQAGYGYLFSYRTNAAAQLLARILQSGLVAMLVPEPFVIEGRRFPAGSILLRTERNPANLRSWLQQRAGEMGVEIFAIDSPWSEEGIKLGSPRLVHLKRPRIAVATGAPTNTPEYGAIWFWLEQSYGVQFTAIQMREIKDADLRRYNVLVFPDDDERWAQPRGHYIDHLDGRDISKLRRWIEAGGTFIGIRGGARFAARDTTGSDRRAAGLAQSRIGAVLRDTPGSIFLAKPAARHLLSSGFDRPLPVLIRQGLALEPAGDACTVFRFAESGILRLSGVSTQRDVQQASGRPYVLEEKVGKGRVILFADDPTFRTVWHGLARVFLNALLLSPSIEAGSSVP